VPEALEAASKPGRQRVARDPRERSRHDVEEHDARLRERGERLDRAPGLDLSAERAEARSERVDDRLRAAARERPTDRVPGEREDQAEGRRAGGIEGQEGMRGAAGEEGS